jgi:hypothetical protein
MRWFGILLIFLNLLAGAGFLYFATQDWKGRQTINAMGLRNLLLLQGLPLEPPPGAPEGFDTAEDETPFKFDMGGGESTKTISKKLLESYFTANTSPSGTTPAGPAAPGEAAAPGARVPLSTNTPVTNQISEVKRVQGLIKAELAKDLPPAEKHALLKGWVLYQAENFKTRVEYLRLTGVKDELGNEKTADRLKADAAELEKILDARFAAVLAKPAVTQSAIDPGDKNAPDYAERKAIADAMPDRTKLEKSDAWRESVQDDTQRRMSIAHLLVHLDTDAAWQKRVMVVIGLRRYVKAITAQVLRFQDMIAHVELGIPGDQAAFIKEETLLREKATQNAERAKAVAEIRAALVEQKTAKDDAVNRQRTQLKELTDQLTKVKNEVDELLVKQTGIEKQLFEIQRVVALTLEEVYRLELLLAATERERFGLTPEKP